jgi:hypothetical protein
VLGRIRTCYLGPRRPVDDDTGTAQAWVARVAFHEASRLAGVVSKIGWELPKEGTHPMSIPPVAHSSASPQQPTRNPPTSTTKRVTPPAVATSAPVQVIPANVSAAILQRAIGDGDGRTGAAALNDGDAAAQAAAQQAKAVDIRA